MSQLPNLESVWWVSAIGAAMSIGYSTLAVALGASQAGNKLGTLGGRAAPPVDKVCVLLKGGLVGDESVASRPSSFRPRAAANQTCRQSKRPTDQQTNRNHSHQSNPIQTQNTTTSKGLWHLQRARLDRLCLLVRHRAARGRGHLEGAAGGGGFDEEDSQPGVSPLLGRMGGGGGRGARCIGGRVGKRAATQASGRRSPLPQAGSPFGGPTIARDPIPCHHHHTHRHAAPPQARHDVLLLPAHERPRLPLAVSMQREEKRGAGRSRAKGCWYTRTHSLHSQLAPFSSYTRPHSVCARRPLAPTARRHFC